MPTTDAIVVIAAEGREPRKVARLVGSRDGSFSVSVPYCPPLPGVIAKSRAPAIQNIDGSGWARSVDTHRVDVPVKMSFHASGFVQFSSVGKRPIRSGRGKFFVPKGMGIQSQPITDPIETGPTFGVLTNALHSFEELDETEKTPIIRFDEPDFFERDDHRPSWRHVYQVEGFVLPRPILTEGRLVDGVITTVKEYAPSRPEWRVRFKFFELPSALACIGIVVSRMHQAQTNLVEGYSISGPRDIGSRLWLSGAWWAKAADQRATDLELPSLVLNDP